MTALHRDMLSYEGDLKLFSDLPYPAPHTADDHIRQYIYDNIVVFGWDSGNFYCGSDFFLCWRKGWNRFDPPQHSTQQENTIAWCLQFFIT